jgi:hypothetical protein
VFTSCLSKLYGNPFLDNDLMPLDLMSILPANLLVALLILCIFILHTLSYCILYLKDEIKIKLKSGYSLEII